MGLSRTEVNLRRLLDAAPRQDNQTKLIHYVTTARELLEKLGAETVETQSLKAKLNEYSQKIEALASSIASPTPEEMDVVDETEKEVSSSQVDPAKNSRELYGLRRQGERSTMKELPKNSPEPSLGLRRRSNVPAEAKVAPQAPTERDGGDPIQLDAEAKAHIEKHRKLQEDLTDEMVVLARQLKESSLVMNQSLQSTDKILDSTEKAIENSLAGTGRANAQATEVYSVTSKTTCLTWLLVFLMTSMFIMVVFLIRVT